MFNAGFFIWKLLVKSWNGIYFDVKRVFHKAVLQLFCDVTIYKDFMKYQRNPQTNLQIRIIKKKSLRGRKDFQCRYVYQYLNKYDLNEVSGLRLARLDQMRKKVS